MNDLQTATVTHINEITRKSNKELSTIDLLKTGSIKLHSINVELGGFRIKNPKGDSVYIIELISGGPLMIHLEGHINMIEEPFELETGTQTFLKHVTFIDMWTKGHKQTSKVSIIEIKA
jgi:hypothetical protein